MKQRYGWLGTYFYGFPYLCKIEMKSIRFTNWEGDEIEISDVYGVAGNTFHVYKNGYLAIDLHRNQDGRWTWHNNGLYTDDIMALIEVIEGEGW